MFTIGEFAQLTEITVKALHHYDDVGVLRPAEIDPKSRYRRYSAAQLRPALRLRALRDADVPLTSLAGVVDDRSAIAVLEGHRIELVAARAAQDRAYDRAIAIVEALAAESHVQVRDAPAQPYVGTVLRIDEADLLEDDEANDEFTALYSRAIEWGAAPTGTFWTTLRSGGDDTVEMVLCIATAEHPADATEAMGIEAGELPDRSELVTAWLGDQSGLVEGVLHPAVVAIFEELEERGLDTTMNNIRQIVLPDGGVEVVTTLHTTVVD